MLRRQTRQTAYWVCDSTYSHSNESPKDRPFTTNSPIEQLGSRRRRNPYMRRLYGLLFLVALAALVFWAFSAKSHATGSQPTSVEREVKTRLPLTRTAPIRWPAVEREAVMNIIVEEGPEPPAATEIDVVNMRWPPPVTAIPEVHPLPDSTRNGLTTEGVDTQFCQGRHPCRILLPLWIGEQESRGRLHLTQIFHLAAALNRTVVLPNVGKSRIGTCGRWSFEAYYDVGSAARQFKQINGGMGQVMFMDDFKTWVGMRPEQPIGQLAFFGEHSTSAVYRTQATLATAEDGFDLYVDDDLLRTDDSRLKNSFCLKSKLGHLRLDARRAISIYANISDATAVSSVGESLAPCFQRDEILQLASHQSSFRDLSLVQQSLSQSENSGEPATMSTAPEVLVVHWDLRHMPFFTHPSIPGLDYSRKLWELAELLTAPSEPYLAIHWRMETVQPDLLPACADALVDTLSTLLADPTLAKGIKTVWLATDMPISLSPDLLFSAPLQRSNTFKSVTAEHTNAMNIVRTAFSAGGALEDWNMTGLAEQMQRVRMQLLKEKRDFPLAEDDDNGLIWEDSGVWGILDKMAAMQSTLFVSGARGCGRVSSFTRQIVEFRMAGGGKHKPRNVVELFG